MIRSLFVADILPRRPAGGAVQRMDVVTGALAELGPVDALFLTSPDASLPPEEAARFTRAGLAPVPPYTGARALLEIAGHGPSAAYARHQRRTLPPVLPDWATGTRYDLVWFSRERTWLPLRGRFTGRTVVDVDDFEDVLIRRWERLGRGVWGVPLTPWQRLQARRSITWWGRVHRRVAREADLAVVAGAGDAVRMGAGRTAVVPNTYPATRPPERPRTGGAVILFQGSFDWAPNADAAEWMVREVLPLVRERVPNATVVLAGRSAPEVAALAGPHVEVTGTVASMTPYLTAADLVVVPLRVGSGTRVKILEAFAHGVPVVSTTIGAEGLDVVPGEHLAVADTADGLARHCADLLTDRARRDATTAAARRFHLGRHLPEHAAALVRQAARQAVAGEPVGTAEGVAAMR
ncbi:glycosyltransferase [Actinacidiphila yeochonensis]|uniref:glycosyltransferase n=1 Tax=Actinacidiphila yeochonensis TaxID=89050 RepID=UPI00068F4786|nr:glycosyltransferase family 4 protein [Actinacidiphila yeochonensis]